jgi:predicted ATPase/DNA-binding SARP family transcriptional activator
VGLQVLVLGGFEVRRDGATVTDWPRAGPRRLLKYLAAQERHSFGIETLSEAFWPNESMQRTSKRLHHLVYLLRSTLEPGLGARDRGLSCIQVRDGVISLVTGTGLRLDADDFEQQLHRLQLDGRADFSNAERTLTLYRGPLLGDEPAEDAWAPRRAQLEARFLAASRDLARRYREQGEVVAAQAVLERLLSQVPADEAAHCALIELYGLQGRHDDAQRQFSCCRDTLARELDASPGPSTQAAFEQAMVRRPATGQGSDPVQRPATQQIGGSRESARRWTSPAPWVSLVGRDALVQTITDRLRNGARLLTLHGPGGVGKTQLAIRVAHEMAPRFANGACFVPLAEARDSSVAHEACRAMGLRVPRGKEAAAVMLAALQNAQLLLVLDNFEHLMSGASQVAQLLQGAPGVAALVTSRRRLNLASEVCVPVEPLRTDLVSRASAHLEPLSMEAVPPWAANASPAILLFCERALAASSDFQLGEQEIDDVQAITACVDGLPLAIELAAARLPLFGLRMLRIELERSLRVLGGGGPDRPERHRSLWNSCAWSYRLLTPEQQSLLLSLCLCAGPFERQDAAGLCETADADGLVLQALLELGFVTRQPGSQGIGEPVFQVVQATREFLNDCLDQHPGRQKIIQRFVNHYAGRAEKVDSALAAGDTPAIRIAVALCECQEANFFAAIKLACEQGDERVETRLVSSLARCWAFCGSWHAAQPWVERAFARAREGRIDSPAAVMRRLARFWREFVCLDRAAEAAEYAVNAAEAQGDQMELAHSLLIQSGLRYTAGQPIEAMAPARKAQELAAVVGDTQLYWFATNNLATFHFSLGDLDRADVLYQACAAHLNETKNTQALLAPYNNRALVAHYRGNLRQAIQFSERAIASEMSGPPRPNRLTLCFARQAWMFCCASDTAKARSAAAKAREAAASSQIVGWDPALLALDGRIAHASGQHTLALELLSSSRALATEQLDQWDLVEAQIWRFWSAMRVGAACEAGDSLEALIALRRMWQQEHPRVLEAAASWFCLQRRYEEAAGAWMQAEALRSKSGIRRFAIEQAASERTRHTLQTRLGSSWCRSISKAARESDTGDPLHWLADALGT